VATSPNPPPDEAALQRIDLRLGHVAEGLDADVAVGNLLQIGTQREVVRIQVPGVLRGNDARAVLRVQRAPAHAFPSGERILA